MSKMNERSRNNPAGKRDDKPIDDKPSTAISTAGTSNPWLEYGQAVGVSAIEGDLLKFSKGDFVAGQDNPEIPIGTRLIAEHGFPGSGVGSVGGQPAGGASHGPCRRWIQAREAQ